VSLLKIAVQSATVTQCL